MSDAAKNCFVSIPSFVERVRILRHPGYNTAYWNLHDRAVTRDADGRFRTGGEPLAFYHFSGFDPNNPSALSKHSDRFTWASAGGASRELFEEFRVRLLAAGFDTAKAWRYAYGAFKGGRDVRATGLSMADETSALRGSQWRTGTSALRFAA